MKWFICITVLCFFAATSTASERHIPFVAKQGDTAKITIDHRRIDLSDYGNKTVDATLVYQANIVEAVEDGYKITWSPKSLTSRGQTVDTTTDRPEVEQDVALEFEADIAGSPLSLTNYDAVRQNGINAVEVHAMRYGEGVIKSVKEMFGGLDAEKSVDVFGKYAQIIGLFQGISIEVGKPRTYALQLPSPLGGGLVDAAGSISLTAVDEQKGTAAFAWEQKTDPASAREVILAVMQAAAKHTGTPVDEAKLRAAKLEITSKATATVRLSDGWVERLHYETTLLTNEGQNNTGQTEIYDITVEK